MIIEPTYVTFEQAKLLKENGFNVDTKYNNYFTEQAIYKENGKLIPNQNNMNGSMSMFNGIYAAPQQWQVIEWLRIKHYIHIIYDIGLTGYYGLIKYRYSDGSLYLCKWINEQENPTNSPQEAYSVTFDYVLTNLIK